MFNDKDVTATLTCGHVTQANIDDVLAGKEFECWACSQRIVGTVSRHCASFTSVAKGWAFQCTGCPYHRAYGTAEVTCRTLAASHAIRKRHTVQILFEGRVRDKVQMQEPTLFDSAIPF